MGEAKEERRENDLGEQSNGVPRDLLQRLNEQERRVMETTSHESEEIELNLGLSLGGRFGVEPKESSKLGRSTSIGGLSTFLAEAAPPVAFPINRTSSLPMELVMETEEEWRKRKETQFLRRLEAKRKRTVKKNNRLGKEANGRDKKVVPENGLITNKGKVEGGSTSSGLVQAAQKNGVSAVVTPNRRRSPLQVPPRRRANAVAVQGVLPSSSSAQASLASSHGNTSSGDSKSENRSAQGPSNSNEVRSSTSIPSPAVPNERKLTPEPTEPRTSASVKVEVESPPKRPRVADNVARETGNNVMPDMPFVSTTGDGPNGRKIQGFLYKYRRGEDVRIVCVCHGKFLTPAEFVRHAGGGDVPNPLRHIVVAQSSPL